MGSPIKPNGDELALARQGRLAAVVIAVAMLMWMGAQFLGGELGLPARFAFLFDLAALAAFVWALLVTYRIWQRRRDSRE